LKPGGILRVVVPDLERIARESIRNLERALASEEGAEFDYNWILLELYDQTVRESSGGQMGVYLRQTLVTNSEYVLNRIGTEALRIIEAEKRRRLEAPLASTRPGETWSVSRKIRSWTKASRIRDKLLQIVLGSKDWKALGVGRFRLGGEIHQWMYDRFSLRRLIEQAGFRGVIQRSATESYIENWASKN